MIVCPRVVSARSRADREGEEDTPPFTRDHRGDVLRTTITRLLMSTIAAMAVAAAACSTPESQPPAASTAEAPAQGAPSQDAPPAQTSPAAAAPRPAPQPAPIAAPAPPPPRKPKVARLGAGQLITVRTTRELSTKTAKTGDVFSAILEEPIAVDDWVVAAAGAKVDGRIVEADKGGRIKERQT